MIEHCISAFRQKQEERIFRVYVTDCLKALCRSDGARFWDLIKPTKDEGQTEVETVNNIKDRMRGINDESAESGSDIIA